MGLYHQLILEHTWRISPELPIFTPMLLILIMEFLNSTLKFKPSNKCLTRRTKEVEEEERERERERERDLYLYFYFVVHVIERECERTLRLRDTRSFH